MDEPLTERIVEPGSALPEITRRLLLSFPDLDAEHRGDDVLTDLVEGAISEILEEKGRSALVTVGDVVKLARERIGLEFEAAEVQGVLEKLAEKSRLEFRSAGHDAFVYSASRFGEVRKAVDDRVTRDREVRNSWIREFREKLDVTEIQAERLWDALEDLVGSMVHSFAAEAAAFIYLSDDASQVRFYNLLRTRLPDLAGLVGEDLAPLASAAITDFFGSRDPSRRDFLADRLQAAFYYHLLVIDPTASALVQQSVAGKTLFLDTNVLYRLLGLHGPALAHGPAAVMRIAERLGISVKVAQETVNEFNRSLRAEVGKLIATPLTREAYAKLAATHATDEWTFMRAYYQELTSGRVKNVSDFEMKYSTVGAMLKGWEIEVVEDAVLTDAIASTDEFRDQASELALWHNNLKPRESIEHDIFLHELIRSLRGKVDGGAVDVKYWMLTYDRRLTVFAVHHASEQHLPFCVLGDTWLQVVRPFLPRTEEYLESFAAMLANPSLMQTASSVPFEHVVDALNRLERYREMPSAVVAAMVANTEFTRRLRATQTKEEEKELIELESRKAIAKVAAENESLKTRVAALSTELETVAGQKHSEARRARQLQRDLAREQERARTAAADRQRAEQSRAEADEKLISRFCEELADVSRGYEGEVRQISTRFASFKRWVAFGVAAFCTSTITGAGMYLWWADMVPMQRLLVGVWLVLADVALLWLPLRRRAFTVLGFLATLVGLVGLTYQLWASGSGNG